MSFPEWIVVIGRDYISAVKLTRIISGVPVYDVSIYPTIECESETEAAGIAAVHNRHQ